MRLILIRHARAAERDPEAWPDDDLRPLVSRGRDEHRSVARALARMDVGIESLLSSPLVRARETAEITARELGFKNPIQFTPRLGGTYDPLHLLAVLRGFPADAVVAAVGHEPHLSDFSGFLLHPEGSIRIEFKKSGVLGIDFEGTAKRGQGTLRFFLTPKLLAAISKK